ncbi:type IV secretory pathway TraG/TraD family ATPase VirD4 [Bradyrhizobium sp. LM6.11]
MSATKILWGQITVVFLIVLLTIWGATQWTAWRLGFQPELGRPWFELAGMPIYYPPVFFWWWYVYDAYAPQVFVEGAFIAASAAASSRSRRRSACLCGVRGRRRMSRPMDQLGGPNRVR